MYRISQISYEFLICFDSWFTPLVLWNCQCEPISLQRKKEQVLRSWNLVRHQTVKIQYITRICSFSFSLILWVSLCTVLRYPPNVRSFSMGSMEINCTLRCSWLPRGIFTTLPGQAETNERIKQYSSEIALAFVLLPPVQLLCFLTTHCSSSPGYTKYIVHFSSRNQRSSLSLPL